MEEIGSSLKDLFGLLDVKASCIRPVIFPTQFSARSIEDLCPTERQKKGVRRYFERNGFDEYTVMQTEIDYPRRKIVINSLRVGGPEDQKLQSLEYMMRLLVLGQKEEVNILNTRFLDANSITSRNNEETQSLQEVCNIAYAIKVAVR